MGEQTGILKARFVFGDMRDWAPALNQAITTFRERLGVRPNIMSAGAQVYREIDEVVRGDLESVVDDYGRHPDPQDPVELAGFQTDECYVVFTNAETTPYPSYLLIFDVDPTFDGEPEPVEDGVVCTVAYKVA